MMPRMTKFEDQDFTDAEFRECDLTRARLIGVVMRDVVIDGLVSNLVVNGVEVTPYVEAELDRRHPVRLLIRSADAVDLRQAHRQLQADWEATVKQLGQLPNGSEHQHVEGEWSAVQTLRHLVFVHDSWFRRCCLGSARPFTAIGLASPQVPDQAEQGLDQTANPSLQEVLAVRHEQALELGSWLASATPSELSASAPVPLGPGWPPYARGKSVLQCLHVVLNEEQEHHGFCVRDLDLLTQVLEGTLDEHSRDELRTKSPRDVATDQLDEEFPSYRGPRDWWAIGCLPDGEPVGFVIPSRNDYSWIIAYIGVLPEHRGHGYIDDLLDYGTRVLAGAGAPIIKASTDRRNAPMAAAFHRCGYSTAGEEIDYSFPGGS